MQCLRVGDWVFSRDEHFGNARVQRRQVTALFRFENRAVLDITICAANGQSETPAQRSASSRRPDNLKYGSFIDRESRIELRNILISYKLAEGRLQSVQVNRALYDQYGRLSPDLHFQGYLVMDASVSIKTSMSNNSQMGRIATATGLSPWVVRPTSLGGSYRIGHTPFDQAASQGYSTVLPPQVLAQTQMRSYVVNPRPAARK
jgi:hypothetical protein